MVFIYNKLEKNESKKHGKNSFMTHQDDREDYSVVHVQTPSLLEQAIIARLFNQDLY